MAQNKKEKQRKPKYHSNTPYNRVVKLWRERGFEKSLCHQMARIAMQPAKTLPELLKGA